MSDSNYLPIGTKLRFARQLAGVSLRQLGSRVGLSAAAISLIETGKQDIGVNRLEEFEAALGFKRGFIYHDQTEAAFLHFARNMTNGN